MNFQYLNDFTLKRVKERSVGDAYERVKLWRKIFAEGIIDENGVFQKVTLKQAAEIVKIPKKTLEDYTQIFNKVCLVANLEMFSEKKMGFLRAYMKKNKSKIRKAVILEKQKKIEQKLTRQNQESEQTIFDQNSIEEDQSFHKFEDTQYVLSFDEEVFEDSCCILFPHPQLKYEE